MSVFSIASAFRVRNKIKARIRDINNQIFSASAVKDAGEPENTRRFGGKTFAEAIELSCALMDCLRDLNYAVERANTINKSDLIALETLKAKIAMYESIAEMFRSAADFRFEANAEGGRDKIKLEPILDQADVLARLEGFMREKDDLEEKLAESNFKTPVDFDPDRAKALL